MVTRRDYFAECNNHQVPVDEFSEQFCHRCYQPDCSRSLYGKTKFDQRVRTWEERLFTNVPRMGEADPRLEGIRAKHFKLILPQAPNQQSAWVDPRDLPERPVQVPVQIEAVKTTESKVSAPQPSSPPANMNREAVLVNTATKSGVMLPGAPVSSPKRSKWEAPPPAIPSAEKIVKQGATVRFGGVEEPEQTKEKS